MAHARLNVRFALLPAGLVLHCVAPSVVETLFDTASELSQLVAQRQGAARAGAIRRLQSPGKGTILS